MKSSCDCVPFTEGATRIVYHEKIKPSLFRQMTQVANTAIKCRPISAAGSRELKDAERCRSFILAPLVSFQFCYG
jgi:hypothetical protein